jgi:tagatose-1,6-bisphosphate aldolase
MSELTIGKLRGLQQIASSDGFLTICAMDHRGSFRNMINPANPESVGYDEMVKRKLELCSTFAPIATAVLIEPRCRPVHQSGISSRHHRTPRQHRGYRL